MHRVYFVQYQASSAVMGWSGMCYRSCTYNNVSTWTRSPTFIFCVGIIFQKGSGAKIDQFNLTGLEVNENVLILHISVQYSHWHAVLYGLHHLSKQEPCGTLTHDSLLWDVVKQIDVLLGPLHHDVETIVVFKIVEHFDDILVFETVE